MGNLDPISV